MRLQTLIRLVAATIVLTIFMITLFSISRYMGYSSDDGLNNVTASDEINRLIPSKPKATDLVIIDSVRKKLNNKHAPKIVFGYPAFEKARSMLLQKQFGNARKKLEEIVAKYPGTPAEREAYRILGEMRMDDLLDQRPGDGKINYIVKNNDSYLKIAAKHDTNLDLLMYLNGLNRLDRLQPNDELVLMKLNFSLRIIPRFNQLFLIDEEGEVIKYFEPVVDMTMPKKRGKSDVLVTTIDSIRSYKGRARVNVTHSSYREASKKIRISNPDIVIISEEIKVDDNFRGIILTKEDMEDLILLLRRSNSVEIRY